MNPSAIQPVHLNRLAIVYERQSTTMQAEHHSESRLRQYQLADRASALGWPAQRCLVIDDDLGISGARHSNRCAEDRRRQRHAAPVSTPEQMRAVLVTYDLRPSFGGGRGPHHGWRACMSSE
ncbi:MAG TPA: hypothetical protein VGL99_16720 [Chloroflexota bacterium]